MVSLYLFGLLQRYGPQHGYQIKKTIAGQLSDFTQIKLPTIYYHLTKMTADGLLSAVSEKPGSRPEKTVYRITEKGKAAYENELKRLLEEEYRPTFPTDGIFYFSDHYRMSELTEFLQTYTQKLKAKLAVMDQHKNETLPYVPDGAKTMVDIIFSHHEHHYWAELAWAEKALHNLTGKGENPHVEAVNSRNK